MNKVTLRAKQVIIKYLEKKIALSDKTCDNTHAETILKEKDNEIAHLRKQLNLLTIQPVHTPKLKQEQ